jgi:hypothetical protein
MTALVSERKECTGGDLEQEVLKQESEKNSSAGIFSIL